MAMILDPESIAYGSLGIAQLVAIMYLRLILKNQDDHSKGNKEDHERIWAHRHTEKSGDAYVPHKT